MEVAIPFDAIAEEFVLTPGATLRMEVTANDWDDPEAKARKLTNTAVVLSGPADTGTDSSGFAVVTFE